MKECRRLMRKASEEWGDEPPDRPGLRRLRGGRPYAPLQLRFARRPRRQAAPGRYDKIHCVPFGEYVPLRDIFPWMQAFAPYDDQDYSVSPGRSERAFPWTGGPIKPIRSASPSATRTPTRIGRGPTAAATVGRRSTSCSTSPTTAGSTAPANTTSIWPSAASAPSNAAAASAAPSTWASPPSSTATAASSLYRLSQGRNGTTPAFAKRSGAASTTCRRPNGACRRVVP